MYAKIVNGQVTKYPIHDLRAELPGVSLPAVLTAENTPEGYVVVHRTTQPAFEPTAQAAAELPPVYEGGAWKQAWEVVDLPAEDAATNKAAALAAMRNEIDEAARALYNRFIPFSQEYELRENQAQAFKSADYTGAVPAQVAAYATPAGKTARQAADTILAQAAGLRSAISQLGVLRMKKVTLKNPNVDIAVARQVTAEVLADIQTLGAQL